MPLLSRLEAILASKRNILRDWRTKANSPLWSSPLGERVRDIESRLLVSALARVHGDCVLWVGRAPQMPVELEHVLTRGTLRKPIYLTTEQESIPTNPEEPSVDGLAKVTATLEQLPFQSSSVDSVVLHHSLEEYTDPRVVLREVVRVLTPGGRLIVCGFNPWSLLGLRRLYAKAVPDVMSKQRLINPIRLFDWFTLLGLELDAPPMYAGLNLYFNRSANADASGQPSHQLPFGGVLVTSAVKQAHSMTFRPLQLRANPRQLAPVSYPRIAQWLRHKKTQEENPKFK